MGVEGELGGSAPRAVHRRTEPQGCEESQFSRAHQSATHDGAVSISVSKICSECRDTEGDEREGDEREGDEREGDDYIVGRLYWNRSTGLLVQPLDSHGAPKEIRTPDPQIRSQFHASVALGNSRPRSPISYLFSVSSPLRKTLMYRQKPTKTDPNRRSNGAWPGHENGA